MKKLLKLLMISCVIFFFIFCNKVGNDNITSLRKIKFNDGWVFKLGDNKLASQIDFNDSGWKSVKIPHDWSIEGPIAKNNPSGPQGGYFPCDIGYYRKIFRFDNQWKNKLVYVTFDGVMCNSEVWINGEYLGKRPNGYIGFTYDLTPYLKKRTNLIVVKADNSLQPDSRWYTGCGIYRNIWLNVKNKISIARNGIYVVASDVSRKTAGLKIEIKVENKTANNADISLISEIYNPDGEKIAGNTINKLISKNVTSVFKQTMDVEKPDLWSVDSPKQYLLVTKLMKGSNLIDKYETRFGIRDMRFETETGFWLNGKNIKIKGVNNHQDAGPVGVAVPNDVLYRRLILLKKMGCNAIRTSHCPFSPEFYNMCDSLGFLVMDEVFDEWIASWPWTKIKNEGKVKYGYHRYFKKWSEKDLTDALLRDRNHPCVFLWSVGNEIPDQCYKEGPKRLKKLMDIIHTLDPTRPVTCGCCFIHLANETGFASMLDITGYNGGGASVFYEKDKKKYPERKFIATEIPHSYQTRGVYKTKTEMRVAKEGIPVPDLTENEVFTEFSKYYSSSYDNSSVRLCARDSWRRTDSLVYLSGEFRWTGFDYLGEAIKGWPSRFFNFGVIDLCGFPKDHYYFYQSQWTKQPMVHILPHWTWPGKEGKIIPVWTYSNCDEVELFLNGKSLGVKSNKGQMNLSWDVSYVPGTLKAVAKNEDKIVVEQIIKTAAKPAAIQILSDKTKLSADGESCVHLEVNILDKDGNFVPDSKNLIKFKITGPATNIGVDNGDPLDLASTKINHRKVFNGKCLLILQSQKKEGEITVEVSSEGLKSACIKIN